MEVISVFENMNEVLDWTNGAARGGVEGGVGLTDIRLGECPGKRSSGGRFGVDGGFAGKRRQVAFSSDSAA